MRLFNILDRATDFGSNSSRKHFLSFLLKILLYILPAVIIGNYTDILVAKLKKYKVLGDNNLYYILLQTMIIITTLYLFILVFTNFVSEFQVTIAGGYFIVLYFGMQTNYIHMLKEFMNNTE
jgi:hypothetical protein